MRTYQFELRKVFFVLSLILFFIIPQDIFSQGPPPWAPAHGYRSKTKHIYFPDQNFYYDVEKRVYLHLENGKWSVSVTIPSIFANINLGTARKVELEISGHTPYQYNEEHIVKYKKPKKQKVKKQKKENKKK